MQAGPHETRPTGQQHGTESDGPDMTPEVTAFITAYNEEDRIKGALESLSVQTFADLEILVVDDGSTDRTTQIIEHYGDDRVRLIRSDRIGRAAALALAASSARGRYLANLDADDLATPDRVAEQVAFLDRHPAVAWVGGGEERVDLQRNEHMCRLYPADDQAIRRQAAKCIPYAHSGVTFRRALVDRGINYDPAQLFLIDFEFFLRVAREYQVANLTALVVTRRLRNESFFQSRFSRTLQNKRLSQLSARAVREFGLPTWYYVYPLLRLAYPLLPDTAKRRVRQRQGLEETVA